MRIAIVHEQYQAGGGMERYLFDLLKGLRDRGDRLDVFARQVDANLPVPLGQHVHDLGFRFVPRNLQSLLFAHAMRTKLRAMAFDFVVSLSPTVGQDVLACGATCRGHLRAVAKRPRLRHRLQIALEARAFASSQLIVAHSHRLAAELHTLYRVPIDRIQVLYPPVDTDRFHLVTGPERREFRSRLGLGPSKTVVLFPAAGDRRKGHVELMQAFSQLSENDYELITVGNPLVAERPNVRHLGYETDMRSMYGAADLTVLPSHYEPFGLVVAESLQCGTPVVVSKHVGALELIGADEGLVLDSLTPESIAAGIAEAARARFRVRPNFVSRNGLTIHEHVSALRNLRIDRRFAA